MTITYMRFWGWHFHPWSPFPHHHPFLHNNRWVPNHHLKNCNNNNDIIIDTKITINNCNMVDRGDNGSLCKVLKFSEIWLMELFQTRKATEIGSYSRIIKTNKNLQNNFLNLIKSGGFKMLEIKIVSVGLCPVFKFFESWLMAFLKQGKSREIALYSKTARILAYIKQPKL